MKALVKTAPGEGNVSLQERPVPRLTPENDVLVRVRACAVCGMDYGAYRGRFPCTPPTTIGHEMVGRVERTLDGSAPVKPGDRVVTQPHLYSCGECGVCRMGLPQFCKDRKSLGLDRDGAMAEFVALPSRYLHVIPESIPDKLACLLEPFSMVLGNFGVPIEEEGAKTALVIGAGQIGMLGVAAAKACGAERVLLSGVAHDVERRFPRALKLGADQVINSTVENVVEKVLEATGGAGADIILEASGSESGINAAVDAVKMGGLLVVMGGTRRETSQVKWDACMRKALRLHFHMMSNYAYMDRAIQMFAKPYTDLSPLVTGEFSLEDWQKAFDAVAEGTGLKNVLYIN